MAATLGAGLAILALISLLASLLAEAFSKIFLLRERHLTSTIETMLGSEAAAFLAHPFFKQLFPQKTERAAVPSHISSDTFASLLLDTLLTNTEGSEIHLRIRKIDDQEFRELLTYFYRQAGEKTEVFQEKIEYWFEQVMTRARISYRTKIRYILFVIGILLTLVSHSSVFGFMDLIKGSVMSDRFRSLDQTWQVYLFMVRSVNPVMVFLAVISTGCLTVLCAPLWFDLFKKIFPSFPADSSHFKFTPPINGTIIKGLISETSTIPEPVIELPDIFEPPKPPAEIPLPLPVIIVPENNILLNIPDINKLHWAITRNRIQLDWWQDAKLTGKNTTIALLGTGFGDVEADVFAIDKRSLFPNIDNEPVKIGQNAALIAAGNGKKTYGVAPESNLLFYAMPEADQGISGAKLIAALDFAIRLEPTVIAVLFTLKSISAAEKQELEAKISQAAESGIPVLAPIGDAGKSASERIPASLPGVLGIGSHDRYAERSVTSGRSNQIAFLAPGEGFAGLQNGTTAAATAFSAGLIALIIQFARDHQLKISTKELYELLTRTATRRNGNSLQKNDEYGFGVLNPASILSEMRKMVRY